jgi:hypothetical protein
VTAGLGDLREVLSGNPKRAREALQALLADKLVFLRVKTPEGKCYEVTGRLAIGGLLRLPADSRMVASTGLASAAELLAGQVERGRLGSAPAAGLMSMALTQSDLLRMSRGPFGPRRSRPYCPNSRSRRIRAAFRS